MAKLVSQAIKQAIAFATKAHAGQVRKYSGEPYITHPIAVANLLSGDKFTDELRVAAILHDVVEDTDVTNSDIEKAFGPRVAVMVWELTDVSRPQHGNRVARKRVDREHLSRASYEAQTIKCADLLDNARSIRKHDAPFWVIFRQECLALLDVMPRADGELKQRVENLCRIK